jgi:formylglycine-generating enzyme required for sulfatase activity
VKPKFAIAAFLLLAFASQPARPQETEKLKPLNQNQVMELVKAGMDSAELAAKVKQDGIDFGPTDDYLQALRAAGAQDVLIEALRAQRPEPLTREQVLGLVAGKVPSHRVALLVEQRGIDFVPDADYLETLRVAGAEEEALAALRAAGEAVTAQLEIETSPNAEVYLDGQLAGRAGADGRFTAKSKPGEHTLRVPLTGKRGFEQKFTLTAGQVNKSAAALADLGPASGTVRENAKDELKYVWVPPGAFQMGCSPGDNECGSDEKPSHQVTITKGFWMDQTPVTVGAYKRFSSETRRAMPSAPDFNSGWTNDNMPIVGVTWDDATAYCGWSGGRLPTEAEWQYAARGGSTEARYGDIDAIAWHSANSGKTTHNVGGKRANGFGLYDMLGNVWEWVNDWSNGNYYQSSPSQDPQGPGNGQYRVLRGGSWYYYPSGVRVPYRYDYDPTNGYNDNGFRCVGGSE